MADDKNTADHQDDDRAAADGDKKGHEGDDLDLEVTDQDDDDDVLGPRQDTGH